MGSDDSSFFGITEERQFLDWLDWGERFISVISIASQRISLAVAAGGFAVAGANIIDKAPMWGNVSMGVAAVFAVWFGVANVAGAKSAGR
jgi:hypothetical protein